jgi:hypothetical protein
MSNPALTRSADCGPSGIAYPTTPAGFKQVAYGLVSYLPADHPLRVLAPGRISENGPG